MKDVDIDLLRPATPPLTITEVIIVEILVEVDLGHNIPDTLPLAILEQEFMLKGEVIICLTSATIPTITQATVVDC